MGLLNALNNRPVRVLGFITALHSLIYGIGYTTGQGGFNGALVGLSINSIVITSILGGVLLAVGALLMFAYVRMNPKTIRAVSYAQGLIWLFITFMYLLNGAYLLSAGIGLTWSIISVYIAYASKNRINIIAYDRTPQAMADTDAEDTL
jgi:hypothetical protein